MKILNAQQIQQWDAYTIEHEPVDSIDLMERAAQCCTDWITERNLHLQPIKIFCGKGNNGGDGLAIARQLITAGAYPLIYIVELGAKGTTDFQDNLQRLHLLTTGIHFIQHEEFFPVIEKEDVVIDALFGSGLNRPLQSLYAQLVQHINKTAATVISIDVCSGMFLEKSSVGNTVVKAKYTLTFQALKLCFLVAENALYFGEVHVLNIGLHYSFLSEVKSIFQLTTGREIEAIYTPRKSFSHKGSFGHALLIAGNKGKMGAAVLAARACLRTGVGLLTCALPAEAFAIMQTAVAEAMVSLREEKIDFTKYNVVGIGPGLGTDEISIEIFKQVIESFDKPMVIDADGLNILAQKNDWLKKLANGCLLTPHPKEFDRLFGTSSNDFDRINKALALSQQYPFVIILKGHYTLIAFAGKGFFNTTGNPGMATGGSGDVLTGILTSLLAQGYAPQDAAVLGVYLHGLSADLALANQSEESLLPSDMIDSLGKAFKAISN